jgi:hypothetical protein
LTSQNIPLFGVPVAKASVHETRALKKRFLPEILRRYEERPVEKPSDYDADRAHTTDGAQNDDAQVIHPIPAAYEGLARQFVPTGPYQMRLWHSVYWKGGEYQEPRHNLPSHFTVLHFLAFDPAEHRRPVLYAPDCLSRAHCDFDTMPAEIWSQEESVDFYEGDALVFPAYMEYAIPPGKYSKPMVIVTMSVSLRAAGMSRPAQGHSDGL